MTEQAGRDDYLIQWRIGLWTQIRQKDDAVWRFISFFASAILLVAGFVQATQTGASITATNSLLVLLTLLVVVIWGILIVLDANFWMSRNLLFVKNIEREILLPEDMGVLFPRQYAEPTFLYHQSYEIHLHALFLTLLFTLGSCLVVILTHTGQVGARLLTLTGTMAIVFCFGVAYIIIRDASWINEYDQVKKWAPGKNPRPAEYPSRYVVGRLRMTTAMAFWSWIIVFAGSTVFSFVAAVAQPWFKFMPVVKFIAPVALIIVFCVGLGYRIWALLSLQKWNTSIEAVADLGKANSMRIVSSLDNWRRWSTVVQWVALIFTAILWATIIGVVAVEYLAGK